MATVELTPQPKVESAQKLEPGTKANTDRSGLLPQQKGYLPVPTLTVELVPPNELPNPRPERVLFGALKDPRLQVIKAVPLDVTLEESNVVVNWADVNEFGTGETLSAAIDDFGAALGELYHQLMAPEVKLGEGLQRIKGVLQQFIQLRK